MGIQFDYFYGNEAEQFAFLRIPKVLFSNPQFNKLSDSAKLLYGLMLDRMGLSIKNGWFDKNRRAYIYFKIDEVMKYMNCASEKATRIVAELDSIKGVGLIERKKQGLGRPAKIYLKKFVGDDDSCLNLSKSEKHELEIPECQGFEIENQGIAENENNNFCESKCNNTKNNNTEINNTDFSNINPSTESTAVTVTEGTAKKSEDRLIDRYNKTIIDIKNQIDYDSLINTNDAEILNNIVNVMADVMLLDVPYYEMENKKIPSELVRIRYRQIDYGSLDAFLIEFSSIYYKIKNPKSYLTTALYNVALTAGTALSNRVRYDMYGSKNA